MTFPTMEEAESANREQLCRWQRFLPSATTEEQTAVQDRIWQRFKEIGGFTPELSKKVGWKE